MYKFEKSIIMAFVVMVLLSAYADDHDKPFYQIAEDYGFPVEEHFVTTSDGYILRMWRIPHGPGEEYNEDRTPVLWQHGAFDSSDALFNHGPALSPAFFLVNQGYDLWIGNARGDKYSRNHTSLNPDKDIAFWEWSFPDRMPDDKANIEYILSTTGASGLAFIGHSEGFTTMLTSMTTDEAEWFRERVTIIIALAPVSKLSHLKSTLLKILGANDLSLDLVKAFGIHEWFYPNFWTNSLFVYTCKYIPEICQFNLEFITDGKPSVNDREAFRVYMGHFPGGLSVMLLDHELQLYRDDKFQYYDYGIEGNQKKYGQDTPPEIDISKVDGIPIAMMVGTSDLLGDVEDNRWLKEQLGDKIVFYEEYDYGCSSFYTAKDMYYLDDVAKLLSSYA